MTQPFAVFSLPRSRSLWLARLLHHGVRRVGHDIALDCETPDDLLDHLTFGLSGTIETGAIEGAPLFREAFPQGKIAVLLRQVGPVMDSLKRAGFPTTAGTETILEERHALLCRLSQQPGVMTVPFHALYSREVCVGLHEHLTGVEPDPKWLTSVMDANIQLDMPARVEKILRNRDKTLRLKETTAVALAQQEAGKWLRVGFEAFHTAWPDAKALTEKHAAEVAGDELAWRPYEPNIGAMEHMNTTGRMPVVTARRGGRLVGYMSWVLQPDIESSSLCYAKQGAWYAEERSGVGLTLLRRSIALLKRAGVDYLEVHHRENGRGRDLSSLFKRFGAIPTQRNYYLRTGG